MSYHDIYCVDIFYIKRLSFFAASVHNKIFVIIVSSCHSTQLKLL